MHALLHGDITRAIGYNWFLLFALPYLLALLMERLLPPGAFQRRCQKLLESKPVVTFYLIAYVGWFILRNMFHL